MMNKLTTIRDKVFQVERGLQDLPQLDIKVTHSLGPGFLARTIEIPKGTYMTGAIQLFDNVNYITKGSMHVLTASGKMEDIKAPWSEITPAGTKRVGYAHEDTVWTTVFITDETDPEKVVETFTTNSEEVYLAFRENLKLEGK